MTEEWRAIPDSDGYEVSSHGRVRGLDRYVPTGRGGVRRQRGCMLKPQRLPKGYVNVGISQQNRLVHHLVLLAFVGPKPPGLVCCHNDGDPSNNHLDNLRWDTPQSNALDMIEHGRHRGTQKTTCPRGHALALPNLVASTAKRGWRDCLACARARVHCRKLRLLGVDVDFVADSNRRYAGIVGWHRD